MKSSLIIFHSHPVPFLTQSHASKELKYYHCYVSRYIFHKNCHQKIFNIHKKRNNAHKAIKMTSNTRQRVHVRE